MKISRAVAGLLLLALVLGTQAGNKCANCGLGEGIDACTCGNTAVRAKKLSKPDFFASPEAIKNALKLKKAYGAPASSYAPSSAYGASPSLSATSLDSALPAPSPVKQNKDLKNLLRLRSGISIAPKFEPIGDLCHSCKGYKNDVVGVVPARPGKLPCKCPKLKSEDNSTPTPSALAAYNVPQSVYGASPSAYSASVSSYSAPVPSYSTSAASYSVPTSLYNAQAASYNVVPAPPYSISAPEQSNPAPLYSGPTAPTQYAAAYQTPASTSYMPPLTSETVSALAQYASAYQQSSSIIYVAAPSSPTKRSYEESQSQPDCNCKSKQHAITVPTQYVAAYQEPASVVYEADAPTTAKRSYKKSNPQAESEAPVAKRSYQNTKSESQCNCKNKQSARTIPAIYTAPQYESGYRGLAPVNYVAAPSSPTKIPCDQSNAQSDLDKDEREAEAYVEIVLQEEQTPTADPVSISLAYKNLADSHGKKYVAEDSLAYGHYKEPTDGRVSKRISNFDEEKLHTVDKPVVELKDCECRNGNCQNIQVSYSDIGFGPVAPSKNRFVPKTDDASNPPYAQSIVYVPPPEDEDGLPYGPLGSTIPGYKSGGVIVNNNSNAKSTCGCGGNTSTVKEGSRQGVLVEEEEYENDSYNGKGGIIERIKSSACKSGY